MNAIFSNTKCFICSSHSVNEISNRMQTQAFLNERILKTQKQIFHTYSCGWIAPIAWSEMTEISTDSMANIYCMSQYEILGYRGKTAGNT